MLDAFLKLSNLFYKIPLTYFLDFGESKPLGLIVSSSTFLHISAYLSRALSLASFPFISLLSYSPLAQHTFSNFCFFLPSTLFPSLSIYSSNESMVISLCYIHLKLVLHVS